MFKPPPSQQLVVNFLKKTHVVKSWAFAFANQSYVQQWQLAGAKNGIS